MKKGIVILLALCFCCLSAVHAQLTPEQEKDFRELQYQLEGFSLETKNGPVGRFQAVPMGQSMFILDTQRGYCWRFGLTGNGIGLIYCGQVRPGSEFFELIYERKTAPPSK